MGHTRHLLDAEVFPVLAGDDSPEEKIGRFAVVMSAVYANGAESCLLNTLSPPRGGDTARGVAIDDIFRRLLDGLAHVARDAGADEDTAVRRAEQALVELQGSLVVARGTDDASVFERMLSRLPEIILGEGR
jgi:TetR/AcrR family transcriptional regulator, lmrAB and yxaGH operons repressor